MRCGVPEAEVLAIITTAGSFIITVCFKLGPDLGCGCERGGMMIYARWVLYIIGSARIRMTTSQLPVDLYGNL